MKTLKTMMVVLSLLIPTMFGHAQNATDTSANGTACTDFYGPAFYSATSSRDHSILKFIHVDSMGMCRMTSSTRYFKYGVGSSRPN